ncbi:MATE family efflux transporter [Vibrio tapetis]|uniref:Multidrug resistance protein NorM n=1 Tax=Vibrio tapetis subsp. tapetis TaxID=1671868 RepID=A0A2N8ZN11_9VIBR|nr:MATE family efflux transporter [Vibrio tapetis]SON53246.1 putative Multi antimicrobial extrusion protein MatE [Vibrio tapetis subsp. tapetis]
MMSINMLEGSVTRSLTTMAMPAAFGMLMTFLFQLVDSYFVGQLGTKELAAMSYAYPAYILIISLFMGCSAGVSAVVGGFLGKGDSKKANQATMIALLTFMVLAMLLGLAGVATADPVFRLLGTPEDSLALVKSYMLPLYVGMFALVGGLIANSVLMAKGIMLKPTLVMAAGGVINLVFDYLLIFGVGPFPALELNGAALATVISWSCILLLMIALLIKEKLITLSGGDQWSHSLKVLKKIMTMASPAIAAQLLNPIAIAFVTRAISSHGDNAVAAFGIVTRMESLVLTGILALSVILTPFMAQNFGANQQQRIDNAIATSGRMTVYWGMAFYIIMIMSASSLMHLFTDNDQVIQYGQQYFMIVGFSFPAFGLALITTSLFNGVEQPKQSLKIILFRAIGLTIPLVLIANQFGVVFIWVALAVSNVIAAWYAGKQLNRWLVERNSSLTKQKPIDDYLADFRWLRFQVSKNFNG